MRFSQQHFLQLVFHTHPEKEGLAVGGCSGVPGCHVRTVVYSRRNQASPGCPAPEVTWCWHGPGQGWAVHAVEGAHFGEGEGCHWLGQAGAVSCGFHSPFRAARVEFSGLNISSVVPQQSHAGKQGENKISVFHGVAHSITQTRAALGRPLPPG